jgi:hypothetical protein
MMEPLLLISIVVGLLILGVMLIIEIKHPRRQTFPVRPPGYISPEERKRRQIEEIIALLKSNDESLKKIASCVSTGFYQQGFMRSQENQR